MNRKWIIKIIIIVIVLIVIKFIETRLAYGPLVVVLFISCFKLSYTLPILLLYNKNLSIIMDLVNIMRTYRLAPDNKYIRENVTTVLKKHFIFSHNFWKLPEYPTIIVSNYIYDRAENITCITIPKSLAIIIADNFAALTHVDSVINNCIIKKKSNDYNNIKKNIAKAITDGHSVFAYITKPSHNRNIGKIRSGMFSIAKELGIPITPIVFDYIYSIYGYIPSQKYRIRVGDTFLVNNIEKDMEKVGNFFSETIKKLSQDKFL